VINIYPRAGCFTPMGNAEGGKGDYPNHRARDREKKEAPVQILKSASLSGFDRERDG